jgi:hypothetical protein
MSLYIQTLDELPINTESVQEFRIQLTCTARPTSTDMSEKRFECLQGNMSDPDDFCPDMTFQIAMIRILPYINFVPIFFPN